MSSRYPPPDQGDTSYPPRERSPPRFADRRSSSSYNNTPQLARAGDSNYRSFEANAQAQSGRNLPREPPRGPKAYVDAPRGGYAPRARGFSGRGDFRDRDFRDSRDAPSTRGARDRDWPQRGLTERRGSPPPRGRTRSPQRENSWNSRDFASRDVDHDRSRRDLIVESPHPSGYRGRGALRGRGRGDSDYGHRGRGGHVDDRGGFHPRGRSQDRSWDKLPRDERDRERDQDLMRRDDDYRRSWEDKDRELDKYKRDAPFRPDSRNSSATNPSTPHSTTGPVSNQLSIDRLSHTYRGPNSDSSRRSSGPNAVFNDRGPSQRTDLSASRPERDRFAQKPPQPPSSPPQAPQVPAFGSISYKAPVVDRGPTTATITGVGAVSRETALQAAHDLVRQPPSAPKAQLLSHAPTAPRAEQQTERTLGIDTRPLANRTSNADRPPNNTYPAPPTGPSGPRFSTADSLGDSRFKGQQTQSQGRQAPEIVPPRPSSSQIAARPTSLQLVHPSRREGIEEPGRQDTASSIPSRPTHREISIPGQQSSAKVPTGPRAERAATSIRQVVPPAARAPPYRQQVPPWSRGQTNLTWVRPGLAQGPQQPTVHVPSIMNKVPTKRDNAGEGKVSTPLGDVDDRDAFDSSWPRGDTSLKAALDAAKAEGEITDSVSKRPSTGVSEQRSPREKQVSPKASASPRFPASEGPSAADVSKGVEDASMDLDDDDFETAERNFNREMQLLEANRPPTPRHHPEILSLLEECNALASASEDLANGLVPQNCTEPSRPKLPALGLPSPKAEESEKMDTETENPQEAYIPSVRNQTPPLESLPFLISGPPTPFSQMDELQQNLDDQESFKCQIQEHLTAHYAQVDDRFDETKAYFANLYRSWRIKNLELEEEEKARSDAAPPTAVEEVAPAIGGVTTSISGKSSRPTVRNASDLQMEAALALSKKTAAEEEEKRTFQPADRVPNLDKEAVMPDMLDEKESISSLFDDRNNLVSNHLVLQALAFVPPKDNFSAEEHDKFVENYILNPKRWGTIAELIPGRNYQDCVQHYYLTKGMVAYKEKEKAFLKIRKGRRGPKGPSGRAKSSNLIPLYDGNPENDQTSTAVTETGRPKRTAAPVFGVAGDGEAAVAQATPIRPPARARLDANGEASAEKPKARGRAAQKERGAKRAKAPLLAAAPGPSSQKGEKDIIRGRSREPKVEMEQGAEDLEGAQLLAGLQNSYIPNMPVNQQSLVEDWMQRQPLPPNPTLAGSQKPAQQPYEPQMQSQEQRTGQSTTSSYWSVPEHQDFQNLLGYFGTNWQAIADTMKTKSVTMVNDSFHFRCSSPSALKECTEQVRNYYNRESQKEAGEMFKQIAQTADDKIKRGDDMGPLPAPSMQTKRRTEATPQVAAQRTLAPSVEQVDMDNASPLPQPSKPIPISSPLIQTSQPRYPALAQAEPAPTTTPVFPQAPSPSAVNAASRTRQTSQQRASQLQGPRSGFFSDERSRPILQAQPTAETAKHRQQPRQGHETTEANVSRQHEAEGRAEALRRLQKQEFLDHLEQQHHGRRPEQPRQQLLPQHHPRHQDQGQTGGPAQASILNPPAAVSQSFFPPNHSISSQVRIAPSQRSEFEPRPRVSSQPQQPQLDTVKQETSAALRRLDPVAPERGRQSVNQSSASGRPPSAISSPAEIARPASVSGPASQPPPRPSPAPGKRSNLMSLLNDEPSEPTPPRRRPEDVSVASSKPLQQSPITLTQAYQPPLQPPQQHQPREQGIDRPVHSSQQQHRPSMGQSSVQQQQQQAQQQLHPREAPSTWVAAAQRLEQQRTAFQSPPVNSPRSQPVYLQQSSRGPFQSIQRIHAPSPPPSNYSHSRTSSYTAGPAQHAQQQQNQSQPQQAPSQPQVQAAPNLQPSPYASIQPHQQLQGHQHKMSVAFNQEQSRAQQEQMARQMEEQRQQDMQRRARQEALLREEAATHQQYQQQQQQQRPHEAPRRQSEQPSFLRPKETGYGEPDRHQERLREYQNSLMRQEQERRQEQARREQGRVYTPPVYQSHGYGPLPPSQQQRGQGPSR